MRGKSKVVVVMPAYNEADIIAAGREGRIEAPAYITK
jgi:hypothetical protein